MVTARVPVAWLCGGLCVTALWGCDGSHEPTAGETAADPTTVLAPGGSAIERLTFFADQRIVLTADENQMGPTERQRPFPLLAYRRFCDGVPMNEVGLSEPRLRLVGRTEAHERLTVDFGDANFTGAGIYARAGGSGCVYLVPSATVALIAAAAGDQAAAPFRAPPQPEITEEDMADGPRKEVVPPWVLQVKKHQAAPPGGDAADRKGG